MSNTYELIQRVRDGTPEDDIGMTSETSHSGMFTFGRIVRALNQAQLQIQRKLMVTDDTLFMTYATASSVASQESYTIPADAYGKVIRYFERETSSGSKVPYLACDVSDRDKYSSDPLENWLMSHYGQGYYRFYLTDNDASPLPVIDVTGTGNLYMHYTKRLPDLDFNVVPSNAGATNLTLGTTAQAIDNYYNNYRVTIVGTGGGQDQTKTITDYSTARVCTVATWTVNPTTSDYYAIECELGKEFEDLLIHRALYALYLKMGVNYAPIAGMHLNDFREMWNDTVQMLKSARLGGPKFMHYTGD